eukprot:UN15137
MSAESGFIYSSIKLVLPSKKIYLVSFENIRNSKSAKKDFYGTSRWGYSISVQDRILCYCNVKKS